MTEIDAPRPSVNGVLYRYRFGAASFDEARFELTVDGEAVALERRPLDVLAMLLRHAGEVVTKEELLETVWSGRATVENVLANAVAKLRKALGDDNAAQIVTVPRVGYRLAGPVERMAAGRRLVTRLALEAGAPAPGRPHFKLERQLAGAGASEVWLARHDKTGEARVYKFSPDGERLAQLKREATISRLLRQALGPREDIVRVVDWNFEEPPFFLECEYGGETLADWAEREAGLAALSFEARLDLAAGIAEAVAAAHEVGVLHKDLKPSNILVAPKGEGGVRARIVDFGAGGVTDPARLEEFGVTPLGLTADGLSSSAGIGTPLYMAPEVVAGEVATARSDVYALGVVACQILAGDMRRPMTTGWEQAVGDPLLCEDIAEATHGDPARRTPSAAAFAAKLRALPERREERTRTEETARRAAEAERALERVRARRPWVAATVGALALGLGASLFLLARAEEARRHADAEAARAEATGAFLSDLLVNADPSARAGGGGVTVREALDRAADGIAARFARAPDAEAPVREKAAEIYSGLAVYDAAAEHRARAAALLEEMHGARDPRALAARFRHAEALAENSQYEEAAAALEAAERDAGPLLSGAGAAALAAAQARARLHLMRAEVEPAAAALERALHLLDADDPAAAPLRYSLVMDLSQTLSRLGRREEAVAMLAALDDPKYAAMGVSPGARASAALYHGAALLYAGRYDEAEPRLKEAIAAVSSVYGETSAKTVEAYSALANLYATSGRFEEAAPVIAEVRAKMCALHGEAHLACMMARGNAGVVDFQRGRSGEAIPALREARDAFEAALGPASPGVHVLGYYLAMAELDAGEIEEAALHGGALDAAALESGSPGEAWGPRVAGLEARLRLARGGDGGEDCAGARVDLERALDEMRAADMQDWIVAPYQKALDAARC